MSGMSNGAKLVIVLVLIFAGAGLYTALMSPPAKKPEPAAPKSPPATGAATPPLRRETAPPTTGAATPGPRPEAPVATGSTNSDGAARPSASPGTAPSGASIPGSGGSEGRGDGARTAEPATGAGTGAPTNGAPRSDGAGPSGASSTGGVVPSSEVGPPTVAPPSVPAPVREAPAPSGPREYTIVEGDTFTSIAEEYFGETRKWVLIARENPSIDPQQLHVGQKIKLPAQDATLPATDAGSTEPATAGAGSGPSRETPGTGDRAADSSEDRSKYVVQQGDTLASIADRFYGTKAESAWRRIFDANKTTIGEDPARLRPGMSLVIPPRS